MAVANRVTASLHINGKEKMRNKTWLVPFFVIGIIGFATLGCQVTDLIAVLGLDSAGSSLTEIVALCATGIPVSLGERITADSANRVTLLARLGSGAVPGQVAWSPDGRTLALPSSFGIYFLDADTLTQVRFIKTPARFVHSPGQAGTYSKLVRVENVAFSPDGSLLASWSTDATVQLWRVSDGSLVRELKDESWVGRAIFNPDGTLIATHRGINVRLWRVSDGILARELKLADDGDTLTKIEFSPDWSVVLSASTHFPPLGSPLPKPTRLSRVSDGSLIRELKEIASGDLVAFRPDGSLLVSTTNFGRTKDGALDNRATVRLWQISDVSLVRESQVPYQVSSVNFSSDGNLIELSDGNSLRRFRVSDGNLLTPDLDSPQPGQGNRNLKDWNSLGDVWFGPDGSFLASGRMWRVSAGNPKGICSLTLVSELKGLAETTGVTFSSDSGLLATSRYDRELGIGRYDYILQLWRVSDGSLVREEKGLTGDVHSPAFSPNGSLIAVGSSENIIRLSRVSDGSLVRELRGADKAYRIVFSPDGSLLASRQSYGNTVRVWRVSDGSLVRELKGEGVIFSPDASLVAITSDKNTLQLWRVSDWSLVRELKGTTGTVTFSPDGLLVVISGSLNQGQVGDDTEKVWQVSDGRLVRELQGATGMVTFSPDGSLLVSRASRELGVLQLWRVSDGSLVHEFWGHRGYVGSFVFSQDGNLLMSKGADGTIGVWGIPGTR
jgi:WD40 repeat protein